MKKWTFFLKILGIIAAVELLAMVLLKIFHVPAGFAEIAIDVLLLSLLTAPFVYFIVVRPFRELTGRMGSLMDNIPGMVYRGHRDWSMSFIGAHVEQVTGRTAGEFTGGGLRWKEMIHTEDLYSVKHAIREAVHSKKKTLRMEYRILHKDGSYRWIEDRRQFIYDEHGGFGHVDGVVLDITERKRTEDALRESEERYRTVMQSAMDAIVLATAAGNIAGWNRGAEIIFGYSETEILGRPVTLLMPSRYHGGHADGMARMEAGGESRVIGKTVELAGVRKDGTEFPLEISLGTFQVAAGRFFSGVIRDITDRKRAEEEKLDLERQLQQAHKMESLGVLAGGIAHDFNNLLTVVLGHTELALDAISPVSSVRNNLTEISIAARRAADLSQQMLAYTGKGLFSLERVNLRELVEEMAHPLQASISKKAILNLNLERDLPPILADPSQIRQIVMNLIINASEAIGDGDGVITVSLGATRCDEEYLRKTDLHGGLPPGLYVHLEVTDTGIGMDEKTRSRIFEPFFSTKFTGRGLGLAAVLGIVRAHRGALKVDSEQGKGTTFKVLFPAMEDAGEKARSSEPSSLADWRGKGTILLVDDEESLVALGARMLEHLGFTVLTAADGLQAVDIYRDRGKEIDLVLMDLTMPHMDGAKAFDEMRLLDPDARVVLASGYAKEDVTSRFEGKKPSGIIQKPYTLARLRETLAGLLPKRLDEEG